MQGSFAAKDVVAFLSVLALLRVVEVALQCKNAVKHP
jgi:hypothetical protein